MFVHLHYWTLTYVGLSMCVSCLRCSWSAVRHTIWQYMHTVQMGSCSHKDITYVVAAPGQPIYVWEPSMYIYMLPPHICFFAWCHSACHAVDCLHGSSGCFFLCIPICWDSLVRLCSHYHCTYLQHRVCHSGTRWPLHHSMGQSWQQQSRVASWYSPLNPWPT